jgi:hypothetical protein
MHLIDLFQTAAAVSVLVLLTTGLYSLKSQLKSKFHCR